MVIASMPCSPRPATTSACSGAGSRIFCASCYRSSVIAGRRRSPDRPSRRSSRTTRYREHQSRSGEQAFACLADKNKIVIQFSRIKPPHVSLFSYRGNAVAYSAGDVFDNAVWDAFDGQQFSLIFSDASHRPEAILSEWKQISARSLLDPTCFTMIWDDLGSFGMREAFNKIAIDCRNLYGTSSRNACLTHVYGWVGSEEPFHPIGIISNQGFVG